MRIENYSPSKLEGGVAEGRGCLLFSPKLGEMVRSTREVCLRAERENCSPKVGELSQSD